MLRQTRTASITLALLISSLLCGAAAEDAAKGKIPTPDERSTGHVAGAKLPTKPALVWRFVPEPVEYDAGLGRRKSYVPRLSEATVADGVVFFGDDGGRVYAMHAADGLLVWRHGHEKRVGRHLTVDDKRVYFTSEHGVTALSRKDGGRLWELKIPHGAGESSPLRTGGSLHVAGYDGLIRSLSPEDGTLQWDLDIATDAPPDRPGFPGERARLGEAPARPTGAASDGKSLYQSIFDQSRIVAVDCKTGKLLWSFQTGGWILGVPAVTDRHVFIGSQDKHMYCFDKKTGEVVWKFPTKSRVESGAAVRNGSIFFGSCDGNLYRVSIETGKAEWTFRSKPERGRTRAIYSLPLVTDEAVCFAAGDGQVYLVELATGKLKWRFHPSPGSETFSTPATDGRRIFVRSRPTLDKEGEHAILAIGEYGKP